MTNIYYNPTGSPITRSQGLSSTIRNEFALIGAAFDSLQSVVGGGGFRFNATPVLTGSTALIAADMGKEIIYSSTSAGTLTLPDPATVAVGTALAFTNINNGVCTVSRFGSDLIFANGSIAGRATVALRRGQWLQLVNNGTDWIEAASNLDPVIDLTGYSGADVALGIGQSVFVDVTAATTVQMRLATGDNQVYSFEVAPTIGAGIAAGTNSFLSPNNTSFAGAFESLINFQANTTPTSSRVTAGNTPILDAGFRVQSISGRVSTKTVSKSIKTHFANSSNTTSYQGTITNLWNDTATVWSAFGTFTFANAITGRITVKREA